MDCWTISYVQFCLFGWPVIVTWILASLHFLRFNNNGMMFTRQRCKCFDICPPLVYQLSVSYHGSSDRTLQCSQSWDLLNNHTNRFSMFQTGINSPFTISNATILFSLMFKIAQVIRNLPFPFKQVKRQ